MPDRFVRDALLTSSRYNDLPPETREFYLRLILVADDFGCYDGREGVCASQCYPLAPPSVEHCAAMLEALHKAGLIIRYSNAGKAFIAIMQWKQLWRGKRKFPAPPLDVDQPDARVTGKFDRDIGWRNPPGFDDVSILLDAKARPVSPQPEEWRDPSHYAPEVAPGDDPPVAPPGRTRGSTRRASKPMPHVTAHQVLHHGSHPGSFQSKEAVDVNQSKNPEADAVVVVVEPQVAPLVAPAAHSPPPTTNGAVTFINGKFQNLLESKRLAWQDMFDALSIPDQIARMEAWLEANPSERDAIQRNGAGFEAFIVRWLLRESRSHGSYQGRA